MHTAGSGSLVTCFHNQSFKLIFLCSKSQNYEVTLIPNTFFDCAVCVVLTFFFFLACCHATHSKSLLLLLLLFLQQFKRPTSALTHQPESSENREWGDGEGSVLSLLIPAVLCFFVGSNKVRALWPNFYPIQYTFYIQGKVILSTWLSE